MMNPSEPCDTCKPKVKSNIGSPAFLGIRKDVRHLLGVKMTETLLDALHACMRGLGNNH